MIGQIRHSSTALSCRLRRKNQQVAYWYDARRVIQANQVPLSAVVVFQHIMSLPRESSCDTHVDLGLREPQAQMELLQRTRQQRLPGPSPPLHRQREGRLISSRCYRVTRTEQLQQSRLSFPPPPLFFFLSFLEGVHHCIRIHLL